MADRMADILLHSADPQTWLTAIWEGLHSHRENCIPEGVPEYDAEWEDICTAMAWLTELAGLPIGTDT